MVSLLFYHYYHGPATQTCLRGLHFCHPLDDRNERLLVFEHSMEAAALPTFQNLVKQKIRYLCYLCKKNHGWPRNRGPGAKLGGCAPPPARA